MVYPLKKTLALAVALCPPFAVAGCTDYSCWGVNVCSEGRCAPPRDCTERSIQFVHDVIKIRARCRVTMETIRLAFPEAVTKEGTEYTLHNQIVVTNGGILEIHGTSRASSPDAAVSLLKLKVRVST